MDNIITICVPLVIAIVSVALPILSDKISTIGEKYKSHSLLELFDLEFPQNKVFSNVSYFYFFIILTLISLVFQILTFEPLQCLKGIWVIENSADVLVLFLTALLTTIFLRWVWIFSIFTSNSTKLLNYLIMEYDFNDKSNDSLNQKKRVLIRSSINDLALYAIRTGENQLERILSTFYLKLYKSAREEFNEDGVIRFSDDLYWLIYNVIEESVNTKKQKLHALEDRAVSGKWLFGEFDNKQNISEETYMWLWHYIMLMKDNNRMLKSLWSSSHQLLNYQMRVPYPKYSFEDDKYMNQDDIDTVVKKRKRFKEVFIALGGLMLYQKNYSFIKYMFTFSQSTPPSYYLLTSSINEILTWFDYFMNDFENLEQPIEYRYWFPEFDNLGNSHQVKDEMCKYLALLFIRQFTMTDYFSVDERNTINIGESDIYKLEFLLGRWSYFNRLVLEQMENKELLEYLNYNIDSSKLSKLLDNINSRISSKLSHIRNNAIFSEEKLNKFYDSTKSIIVNAFNEYEIIQNKTKFTDIDDNYSTKIEGGTSLITKSAFIDNDISHLNYDTSMASAIETYNINTYVPNSFVSGTTCNYTIESDKVLKVLDKLLLNLDNKIIVGMSVDWQTNEIINGSKYKDIYHQINNSSQVVYGSIFILDKKDLPYFEFIDIKEVFEKTLKDNGIDSSLIKLNKLSEEYNIYAFVEDFNQSGYENVRKYYDLNIEDDELKVLIYILFKCVIRWNKERSIVRLNFVSEFMEHGITNDINDIQPL